MGLVAAAHGPVFDQVLSAKWRILRDDERVCPLRYLWEVYYHHACGRSWSS